MGTGMGVQDIVALLVAAAAVGLVGRSLVRALGGRGGCRCDRGDPCKRDGGATAVSKRMPLVTPDQVGRPRGGPRSE